MTAGAKSASVADAIRRTLSNLQGVAQSTPAGAAVAHELDTLRYALARAEALEARAAAMDGLIEAAAAVLRRDYQSGDHGRYAYAQNRALLADLRAALRRVRGAK